jgi:hypothetical protein
LPVPVSPTISTGARSGANRRINAIASLRAGDPPTKLRANCESTPVAAMTMAFPLFWFDGALPKKRRT